MRRELSSAGWSGTTIEGLLLRTWVKHDRNPRPSQPGTPVYPVGTCGLFYLEPGAHFEEIVQRWLPAWYE